MYTVNGKITIGAGSKSMIEYWRIDDTETTVPFALAINQPFVMISDRGMNQERSFQFASYIAHCMNAFLKPVMSDTQAPVSGGKPQGLTAAPNPTEYHLLDIKAKKILIEKLDKEVEKDAIPSDALPANLEELDKPTEDSNN